MTGGALLLAAGHAKRFGGDKRLHVVEHLPLLAQTITTYQQVFERLVVIVRTDDIAVTDMLKKHQLTPALITAPDADLGMGHSLAAGIEQIQSWDYVFIGLADMPFIKTRSLKTLNEALTNNTQIIQPIYKGENGHPVGFGSAYFEKLMALSGDTGARSVVHQYPQQVTTINLNDSGLIQDIDTPDQLLDKFA